jgi:integrase
MARRTFGSIRPLSKGRFQARYIGPDGHRYNGPQPFTSRKNASAFLSKVETEISAGKWHSPSTPKAEKHTFGPYAVDWVEHRPLTPKTRAHYQRILDKILVPYWGGHDLSAITVGGVERWFTRLPQDTPTQNAHAYSLLRTILNTAVRREELAKNPCKVPGAGTVKRAKTIRPLTMEQVFALANAIEPRYRALVLLTAFACLRFGEVTELRRIDVTDGVLHVRRGVTWVDGESVVGQPKSLAGVRDVPLPAFLRPILAEHILAYAGPVLSERNGLLFPAPDGGHIKHAALWKIFHSAQVSLGWKEPITFHGLRHTGAVLWAQEQATLKDLMTLLGHETPQMAMRYQHLAEGSLERLAARVSASVGAE